jgi:hypothetical protein
MKNLLFGLMATVLFAFNGNAQETFYQTRKVNDEKEMESIRNFASHLKGVNQEYDFNNINIISQKENPKTELIVVNSNNFNNENSSNKALLISYVDKEFGNNFFIETNTLEKSKKEFSYFDANNSLLYSANFDSEKEIMSTSFSLQRGCGQAVADCMNDVYTNHGWVSVWALVQSAFIPQTIVAFAIVCTAKNCR